MICSRIARLAAVALLAASTATAASAQSQQDRRYLLDRRPLNIFEAMFPELIDQRIQRERVLLPPEPIEKISAPRYFTYEPVPMTKIALRAHRAIDLVQRVSAVLANVDGGSSTDAVQTAAVDTGSPDLMAAAFDRLAGKFDTVAVLAEPEIAKAVSAYYAAANKPLWLDQNLQPNARARTVMPVFGSAAEYGLEPEDYQVDPPVAGTTAEATEADAARFEIAMTARALRYATDARAGRINPNKISEFHDFPENRADPEKLMQELATGLPAKVLVEQNPPQPQFEALRRELAALAGQQDDAIVIADGTLIKPGMESPELAKIIAAIAKKSSDEFRGQFPAIFAPDAVAATTYTPELGDMVKAYQKANGLAADGIIGRATIARLTDLGVAQKRQRVLMAMEELRWHPRDLGNPYVFINQPAFRARFVENGKSRLDMRVVVGTATNQTSFFYDTIETVEYNPYWGIPQSILVNEYLPKLRQNPAYLDERGYIVTDAKGRQIASANIDWWSMGGKVPYDVRQLPGEANALGDLKILFPNKHSIYMHDTPAKELFSRDERAYSHGCVRLQQPNEMAAAVLATSIDHIKQRLAEGHGQEDLKRQIPVYVAYFTAWPNDDGKVEYFADVYGRDAYLEKAIEVTRKARNPAA